MGRKVYTTPNPPKDWSPRSDKAGGSPKGAESLGPIAPRPESELQRAREVVFSFAPHDGTTLAERQEWRAEIMAMLRLT